MKGISCATRTIPEIRIRRTRRNRRTNSYSSSSSPERIARTTQRTGNGSDGGDRLDFDQESFLDQPVDHEKRVRRILSVPKHLWNSRRRKLHEPGDILRMDEICRELNDVGLGCAG